MIRLQRKRTKGFKLPPNTLVVTRGTPFGNDWKVVKEKGMGRYNQYILLSPENKEVSRGSKDALTKLAISNFERDLTPEKKREFVDYCVKREIKSVACFCPIDSPCHGDVWIEVWNEYQKQIGVKE